MLSQPTLIHFINTHTHCNLSTEELRLRGGGEGEASTELNLMVFEVCSQVVCVCVFGDVRRGTEQKRKARSRKKRGSALGSHTHTCTRFSGCCGMFGAVPRQIRAMLAVFDGQPGQTRPARHKLLRHMMSGRTHTHTHTHKHTHTKIIPRQTKETDDTQHEAKAKSVSIRCDPAG